MWLMLENEFNYSLAIHSLENQIHLMTNFTFNDLFVGVRTILETLKDDSGAVFARNQFYNILLDEV